MTDNTATERMKRYWQRQREKTERHAGKVLLRGCYATPAAHAMLSILAEQYGDVSAAIEEATRRLHASHYRAVISDVTVTARSDKPAPRAQQPEQTERRAGLISKVKELHAQGLTANRIATVFNTENVPTLSGCGKRRHPAIQGLLAEAG